MNIVQQAAFICKNESFHRFLEKRQYYVWDTVDEKQAAHLVREICRIKSRSELQTSAEAAKRFNDLVGEFQRGTTAQAG